ncbi:hypothetical protein DENSPDRAFT_595828 [Dentipellis sp. KUC8613]|nr:hypothetical protein DENSPDRAFT_595828 [Dentipellis sp. KUC8613]
MVRWAAAAENVLIDAGSRACAGARRENVGRWGRWKGRWKDERQALAQVRAERVWWNVRLPFASVGGAATASESQRFPAELAVPMLPVELSIECPVPPPRGSSCSYGLRRLLSPAAHCAVEKRNARGTICARAHRIWPHLQHTAEPDGPEGRFLWKSVNRDGQLASSRWDIVACRLHSQPTGHRACCPNGHATRDYRAALRRSSRSMTSQNPR